MKITPQFSRVRIVGRQLPVLKQRPSEYGLAPVSFAANRRGTTDISVPDNP